MKIERVVDLTVYAEGDNGDKFSVVYRPSKTPWAIHHRDSISKFETLKEGMCFAAGRDLIAVDEIMNSYASIMDAVDDSPPLFT